jgi:hypothetical protein
MKEEKKDYILFSFFLFEKKRNFGIAKSPMK